MRPRKSIAGVLYVQAEGSAGQAEWQPSEDAAPDPVACNVRPLTTTEIQFYGDRGKDIRKVFAKSWPFDMHSRLTFEGDEWDQVEPEQRHDYGTATQHVEVLIQKR